MKRNFSPKVSVVLVLIMAVVLPNVYLFTNAHKPGPTVKFTVREENTDVFSPVPTSVYTSSPECDLSGHVCEEKSVKMNFEYSPTTGACTYHEVFTTYTCTRCGQTITDSSILNTGCGALSHDF